MDIQVECVAEAVDQGDGAGPGVLMCEFGLTNQVRGQYAIDDAQHLAHDRVLASWWFGGR